MFYRTIHMYIFIQNLHTSIILFFENSINFIIDLISDFNTFTALLHHWLRPCNISWTNRITHSHLLNHHLSSLGALNKIIWSTCCYFTWPIYYFFSYSSSKTYTNSIFKVFFWVHSRFHNFFIWSEDCNSSSSTSWYYWYFAYLIIFLH